MWAILKGKSESWICTSICLSKIWITESAASCLKVCVFFILNSRVFSQEISFEVFLITFESFNIWCENLVFMISSWVFVMLDSLQKCTSPHGYILVLNRNHLIKINGLPLILDLRLLVFKSNLTCSKWLEVIPCAQLIIQNLQFVLNLGIVCSRTWIGSQLFWNLLHEISLSRRREGILHIWIWIAKRWTNLLKNLSFFGFYFFVRKIIIWWRRL